MSFSQLLEKMANGEVLTPIEKQSLMLEARRLEEVSSLVTSIIQPGTKNLNIDGLTANNAEIQSAKAGGGDVSIDDDGVWIKNQQAAFGFEDTSGNRFNIYISSSSDNFMQFVNQILAKGFDFYVEGASDAMVLRATQDADDVLMLKFFGTLGGSRLILSNGKIDLRGEGTGGANSTFVRVMETTNTPPDPGQNDAYHAYVRNDKFIIQYNDAGTVRYKYLDLTGTGVTWVHTTSAP